MFHRFRQGICSLRVRQPKVVLFILLQTCFSTPPAWTSDASLADRVKSELPPYVGAAVMAIDDGETIFKQAWGVRRHGQRQPCTPATNFRLASITKHFTATSILLLVDQGDVALEDPLAQFFPDSPEYWRQITVHHLLTHTSGLPDYEELIPEGTTLQLSDLNVLALLRDTPAALFEPGARFAYSNSGYVLLGLIVEVVTQRPFHHVMQTEVFAPVGMKHSILFVDGMNRISQRAFGHEPCTELADKCRWRLSDQSITSALRGDGGIYSSLNDLECWLAALDSGLLLSTSSRQAMLSPQVKTDRGEDDYGYGWFLGSYRGERRVMHAGRTRGFSVMLQRFPDRQAAVVLLLNRTGPQPATNYVDPIVDMLLFPQTDSDR